MTCIHLVDFNFFLTSTNADCSKVTLVEAGIYFNTLLIIVGKILLRFVLR